MPPVAGNHIRITAGMRLAANDVQNVFHYQVASAGSAINNSDFMDDIAEMMDVLYTTIQPDMTDQLSFDLVTAQVEETGEPMGFANWPVLTVGGDLGNELPEATCALLRVSTGLPKREGRKYFGTFTENNNGSGGVISTALNTAIANFYLLWVQTFVGAAHGVTLQPRIKTVQLGVNVYVPLGDALTNNQWDYQRRRKFGVGS